VTRHKVQVAAARHPAEQRRPALLFAAVNLLIATQPDSELAAYYPIHGGRRQVDGQLLPAFATFYAEHRDALAPLLQHRSKQTNETPGGLGLLRSSWPASDD